MHPVAFSIVLPILMARPVVCPPHPPPSTLTITATTPPTTPPALIVESRRSSPAFSAREPLQRPYPALELLGSHLRCSRSGPLARRVSMRRSRSVMLPSMNVTRGWSRRCSMFTRPGTVAKLSMMTTSWCCARCDRPQGGSSSTVRNDVPKEQSSSTGGASCGCIRKVRGPGRPRR